MYTLIKNERIFYNKKKDQLMVIEGYVTHYILYSEYTNKREWLTREEFSKIANNCDNELLEHTDYVTKTIAYPRYIFNSLE